MVKNPPESGDNFNIDYDFAGIEKSSFNSYSETEMLINVIERYYKHNGLASECVLVDKIYRKRKEYKLFQIA